MKKSVLLMAKAINADTLAVRRTQSSRFFSTWKEMLGIHCASKFQSTLCISLKGLFCSIKFNPCLAMHHWTDK